MKARRISPGIRPLLVLFAALALGILYPGEARAAPRGPRLGQAAPGKTAAIFSPGFVSLQSSTEYGCCLSADGTEFYFTRASASQRIMQTRLVDGEWTVPAPFAPAAGFPAHEPCLSPDGKTLYFGWFHPLPAGEVNTMGQNYGIYACGRLASGWSEPRYVGQGMYVSFAADGSLYVTGYEAGGRPFLSRAVLKEGRFASLERLGGSLKNPSPPYANPTHPAIAPDGSYILFDIDGGEHLFVSFVESDGTWGKPIDLAERGFPIGAGFASISPDGECIFYTSERDIWWVSSSVIEELRPPTGERLVYHAYPGPGGKAVIFASSPRGADPRALTDGSTDDVCPVISPDGSLIAFLSDGGSGTDPCVMAADGSGRRGLGATTRAEGPPRWSPDGKSLVSWIMGDRGGEGEIFAIDADGTNRRVLARMPQGGGSPDISPDGSKLLFSSEREGASQLYVMDMEGGEQRRISSSPIAKLMPKWSPDGTLITYTELISLRGSRTLIHVMAADGSWDRALPPLGTVNEDSSWSPDGKRLVFQSNLEGNYELYSCALDGSGLVRITRTPYMENYPFWGRAP